MKVALLALTILTLVVGCNGTSEPDPKNSTSIGTYDNPPYDPELPGMRTEAEQKVAIEFIGVWRRIREREIKRVQSLGRYDERTEWLLELYVESDNQVVQVQLVTILTAIVKVDSKNLSFAEKWMQKLIDREKDPEWKSLYRLQLGDLQKGAAK